MPNWCFNTLHIEGSGITECLQRISGENGVLDFQSVIPMPESLRETEASSTADQGLIILGKNDEAARRYLEYPWVKEAGVVDLNSLKAFLKRRTPDAEERGLLSLRALEETGFRNWYDWCIANWGTKWNADAPSISHEGPETVAISFFTAWSPPRPIVLALSKQFADLLFSLKYEEPMLEFRGDYECRDGCELCDSCEDWQPDDSCEDDHEKDLKHFACAGQEVT